MSDRFKFRAKRPKADYWVIGGLHYNSDLELCITDISNDEAMCYIIDPETVGQCTGLKDKNGTLIFEGDIVRNQCGYVRFIRFSDTQAMFKISCGKKFGVDAYFPSDFHIFGYEIIGNIHENKELLEQV
ncbi:MAG: YopX family protein [Candidatus Heimdallarchaeaceae archaeon]